ncbi:MAG: TetR/AcrR family transcriptional regulator, partial [Ktedonobacterales bacterium]
LATYEEIKRTARSVMAAEGTAGVSLRAIAAEMGLTPPALYRYYASRDDLLTTLIASGVPPTSSMRLA